MYLMHEAAASEDASEVAPGWVKLYSDMQKVCHVDKLGIPLFSIISSHPESHLLRKFGWGATEMELLRDFGTSEEDAAYAYEWLSKIQMIPGADPKAIGKHPAQYQYLTADQRYEQMIVTLKNWPEHGDKGCMPPWISRLPDDYYSKFALWKKKELAKERS